MSKYSDGTQKLVKLKVEAAQEFNCTVFYDVIVDSRKGQD